MRRTQLLVIEDVASLRAALRLVLERFGFTVLDAANGREGIALATLSLPDVVVTDLSMPVLDGWNFLRALRQDHRTSDVPAIAMTARDDVSLESALAAGFDALLRKPFTQAELLAAINRVCKRLEGTPDEIDVEEPRPLQ